MYRKIVVLIGWLLSSAALSHEMTPTYLKLQPSYVEGIYGTSVSVFNRRDDVEYYEVGVFDKDFNTIPFKTVYKIIKVDYLSQVNVDVYIRSQDVNRTVYICSQSKLRKDNITKTAVASRICSKIK
jgi:hypothetical protein